MSIHVTQADATIPVGRTAVASMALGGLHGWLYKASETYMNDASSEGTARSAIRDLWSAFNMRWPKSMSQEAENDAMTRIEEFMETDEQTRSAEATRYRDEAKTLMTVLRGVRGVDEVQAPLSRETLDEYVVARKTTASMS